MEVCDMGSDSHRGSKDGLVTDPDLVPSIAHSRSALSSWRYISVVCDCPGTGKPLGLKFEVASPQGVLMVCEISADSCLQGKSSKEREVAEGDVLLAVSGQGGSIEILQRLLQETIPKERVALTFVRVSKPEAVMDWDYINEYAFGKSSLMNEEVNRQASREGMVKEGPAVSSPSAVIVKESSGRGDRRRRDMPPSNPLALSGRSRDSGSTCTSSMWNQDEDRVPLRQLDRKSRSPSRVKEIFGRCKAATTKLLGKPAISPSPSPPREVTNGTANAPVLLHFDVNKTIIHSDTVSAKNTEDGVREAVSDIYWGYYEEGGAHSSGESQKGTWKWTKTPPHLHPPKVKLAPGVQLCTYFKFCKRTAPDKESFKKAVRSFGYVSNPTDLVEMERTVEQALRRLELPAELLADEAGRNMLREVGLTGNQYFMVPTLFHLVASLQRQQRPFAVLFRSFGKDHEKVKAEWNAFCELRHPVFSRLIADVGPLDGSVPHLPDRRVNTFHTLYRDSDGPVLILDTFTNGPEDKSWDSWAKAKPKPDADTRQGRQYIKDVLQAKTVEGLDSLQAWMHSHLASQSTAAIKDDWAWWQFHGESAAAGKLLPLLGGQTSTTQVFFDDNIDLDDPRIVDCRTTAGDVVPVAVSLGQGFCVKVNPVEALLEDDYFLEKLSRAKDDSDDDWSALLLADGSTAEEKGDMMLMMV
eukprot:CAMPEP_0206425756 /NCGR_PEP_ID=MMETSP0324_2-20121206/3975_1 /ASSEMBLY_ACC=CAM_ASM_000836 /TAXON_ID=2866 /ORGANISM="Crypthecodinium cohnii, Strain Seligo" /LENGTH=696 /DNA_ID=CAMNT_0053890587 /DNA_START=116 /DNA_END=2204 /DNA_ORIENTATION=+